MIHRLLSRLFGGCCCSAVCQYTPTVCKDEGCDGSCPPDDSRSCMTECPSCPPHLLGCHDIRCLRWICIKTSECELAEQERLTADGFEEWRQDPVSVAAAFLTSGCVPCNFRGKPAYLKCTKTVCEKTYVLLGISCVGEVAAELDCKNLCNGKKFYRVCRIAYI